MDKSEARNPFDWDFGIRIFPGGLVLDRTVIRRSKLDRRCDPTDQIDVIVEIHRLFV